jgi:hypothetical protein
MHTKRPANAFNKYVVHNIFVYEGFSLYTPRHFFSPNSLYLLDKSVRDFFFEDIFFSKSFYLLDKSVRDFVVHGTWREKKLKKTKKSRPQSFGIFG